MREYPDSRLDKAADSICERGLQAPAVFMLEMYKPLLSLFQATAVMGAPFLKLLLPPDSVREISEFLDSRENIEKFIQMIEERG